MSRPDAYQRAIFPMKGNLRVMVVALPRIVQLPQSSVGCQRGARNSRQTEPIRNKTSDNEADNQDNNTRGVNHCTQYSKNPMPGDKQKSSERLFGRNP